MRCDGSEERQAFIFPLLGDIDRDEFERVRGMIWDPETPPEKLAELERIIKKCHALYFRGR